jgi:hypothetical protein
MPDSRTFNRAELDQIFDSIKDEDALQSDLRASFKSGTKRANEESFIPQDHIIACFLEFLGTKHGRSYRYDNLNDLFKDYKSAQQFSFLAEKALKNNSTWVYAGGGKERSLNGDFGQMQAFLSYAAWFGMSTTAYWPLNSEERQRHSRLQVPSTILPTALPTIIKSWRD